MSKKSILCVDDSATMRTIVEKTFFAEPYDVVTVPSGEAAIEKVKEIQPDLILADAGMVGVTGYDVCKAVRDDAGIGNIPVIIMSGVSSPYDENKARDVGATDHIKKPFDTTKLIEKVAELCSAAAPAGEPEKPKVSPVTPRITPTTPKPAPAQGATLHAFPNPIAQKTPVVPPVVPPVVRPVVPPVVRPVVPPVVRPVVPPVAPPVAPPIVPASPKETMEFGAAIVSEKPKLKEVVPIEIDEQAGEDADIQVGTLAELAQMNEKGETLEPVHEADALELDEPVVPEAPEEKPAVKELIETAAADVAAKVGGLTSEQAEAIRVLTAEVIEQVVWEVVPDLAETIIQERIDKLLEK